MCFILLPFHSFITIGKVLNVLWFQLEKVKQLDKQREREQRPRVLHQHKHEEIIIKILIIVMKQWNMWFANKKLQAIAYFCCFSFFLFLHYYYLFLVYIRLLGLCIRFAPLMHGSVITFYNLSYTMLNSYCVCPVQLSALYFIYICCFSLAQKTEMKLIFSTYYDLCLIWLFLFAHQCL